MNDIESLASSLDLPSHTEAPQYLNAHTSNEDSLHEDNRNIDSQKEHDNPESSPSIVPRSERRGLLSRVSLMPEYYDPKTYSPRQKLTIVGIIAFAVLASPMSTTILLPAIDDVASDLKTTVSMVNISIGSYVVSLGFFPMWWSSFSEKHGRRSVYVISFMWFFLSSIGCALAPSITSLIVLRLSCGMGASAIQACGAGTISDMYIQEERGAALGLFYLGSLLGPFLSPILGGAVAQAWGWRATMWVMVIMCGINVASIIFLLPETLPRNNGELMRMAGRVPVKKDADEAVFENNSIRSSVISNGQLSSPEELPIDPVMPMLSRLSTNQSFRSNRVKEKDLEEDLEKGLKEARSADDSRKESRASVVYDYTIRPVHAVVLLAYPPVLLAILYSGIAFLGIYLFNITTSNQYSRAPYNFSSVKIGLLYIPNSIAFILASVYGGKWSDWLIKRSARRSGQLVPESRISWNIVVAAVLIPPGSMIFGWCLDKKEHWVTPMIGSVMFGFGSMLATGVMVTYIADLLPGKAATGMALNNLVRQLLGAAVTFVADPWAQAMGTGVVFSIYAGLISLAALVAWVLKTKGGTMRDRYDVSTYYARL